eukprot:TRINITY_DN2404_c0_g2_i14.p2 TRINITY_DN2404_c0_g2~~TRINITY_DN2404_c0_g2_i14.p2  ORF type:complete len:117 (-),score=2.32 TRINITY_DN2404_c0_g2_i14:144-494(-)
MAFAVVRRRLQIMLPEVPAHVLPLSGHVPVVADRCGLAIGKDRGGWHSPFWSGKGDWASREQTKTGRADARNPARALRSDKLWNKTPLSAADARTPRAYAFFNKKLDGRWTPSAVE